MRLFIWQSGVNKVYIINIEKKNIGLLITTWEIKQTQHVRGVK